MKYAGFVGIPQWKAGVSFMQKGYRRSRGNAEKKFDERLNVQIHTIDSEAAKGYTFKSSTNVLLDNEWLPLDVATDKAKMEQFLTRQLAEENL